MNPIYRISIGAALLLTLLFASCKGKEKPEKEQQPVLPATAERLPGDLTLYGLACDGCSDSIVVLLPPDGSDPIRYNIVEAQRQHRVLGKPKIGDQIGVLVNAQDRQVADLVVDIDQLKGIWCYVVMPTLRHADDMSLSAQAQALRAMPDSVKNTYFIPREYGFALLRNWTAQSVGYVRDQNSLGAESPVEYPKLGYFTEWHLWNGKLIITSGRPQFHNDNTITVEHKQNDTCDIVFLRDDSLVLASDGLTRSYYRKESMSEVNKKARAVAAELQKKAIEDTKQ